MVRLLDPVRAALEAAPQPVRVFFRDDDAGWRAASPRVGVMFHHAEMDDDDVDRADELLALLARHDRADAQPMMAIVRGSRGP